VFKDRTADQVLVELLQSRTLRSHRLSRNCEIGPFILDYVFGEQSLVVELHSGSDATDRRTLARAAFLGELGYRIVRVSRHEVLAHPQRTLARIRAALQ
jgi:very-short-patch-repair endonuclease